MAVGTYSKWSVAFFIKVSGLTPKTGELNKINLVKCHTSGEHEAVHQSDFLTCNSSF